MGLPWCGPDFQQRVWAMAVEDWAEQSESTKQPAERPERLPAGSPDKVPESPVYVYGIVALPLQTIPPLGFQAEVTLVEVGPIAAVVEPDLDVAAMQADDQQLLTAVLSHDRVICELFQSQSILPMRFGTQLASATKLRQHLTAKGATYTQKLTYLAERAEYQLKLVPQPVPLPPLAEGLKGREYFLAKKQRLQQQSQQQQQQQQDLARLLAQIDTAYPQRVQCPPGEDEQKIYLLLATDEAAQLQQYTADWLARSPGWQLSWSEALPPYHFV